MKKALKTALHLLTGLVIILLLLYLVVYFFLPGLPYYALAKYNCRSLDKEVTDCDYYDVKNTDTDSYKIDFADFSIYIPDSCVFIKQDGNKAVYRDDSTEFSIMPDTRYTSESDFDFDKYLEGDSLKKAKLDDWFDSSGYEYPKTFFDYQKLVYSISSEEFKYTDKKQCVFCYVLATNKEILADKDKISYYERGNIKGFVRETKNMLVFNFYNTNDLTKSYLICAVNNKELAYKTFNSIEFK
jgi:hypothetical protein